MYIESIEVNEIFVIRIIFVTFEYDIESKYSDNTHSCWILGFELPIFIKSAPIMESQWLLELWGLIEQKFEIILYFILNANSYILSNW